MSALPLGALLYARDSSGIRIHSDDDVAYVLPLLVFVLGVPAAELPEPVQLAFLKGCSMCGLTGDETADGVGAAISAAYEHTPIENKLLVALNAWARASIEDATTPNADRSRLNAFLGSSDKPGILGGGERPTGTIAGGPLARFAAVKK